MCKHGKMASARYGLDGSPIVEHKPDDLSQSVVFSFRVILSKNRILYYVVILFCSSRPARELDTNVLQRYNKILDTLVQLHVLHPKNLLAATVVELEELLGEITAGSILLWQLISILGEVLANNVDQISVAEGAVRNDKKSLSSGFLRSHGFDMSVGNVADVHPDEDTGLWDLGSALALALDEVTDTFVGSVERV